MTPEEAHIVAQAQLRELTVQGATLAWRSLSSYNTADAELFLKIAVPLVLAAQRQSAALTNAFLAQSLGRPPAAIDVAQVIGPAIRAGAEPAVVYRRPFVTTWTMLGEQKPYVQAVKAGLARAQATAAMDVQNTMRHTLRLVGDADEQILGYHRIPDADACPFCKLIAGRRYRTGILMEVHPRCGCGVGVITAANRDEFFGKETNDLAVAPGDELVHIIRHPKTPEDPVVAVAMHGELGPLLVDGRDHFTGPDVIAA